MHCKCIHSHTFTQANNKSEEVWAKIPQIDGARSRTFTSIHAIVTISKNLKQNKIKRKENGFFSEYFSSICSCGQ